MILQEQRSVKMELANLTVHSIYGAIYRDGEFVQRGAVIGLSVDTREVVVAPVSGWVCVLGTQEHEPSALEIQIVDRQLEGAAT